MNGREKVSGCEADGGQAFGSRDGLRALDVAIAGQSRATWLADPHLIVTRTS